MTERVKYVCHCDNCGDEFWIDLFLKTDTDEVRCPTCKKMTPLKVISTACKVIDAENTCNCDEFKKILLPDTGNAGSMVEIGLCRKDKGKFEINGIPINFCPWCGKKVPEKEDQNE